MVENKKIFYVVGNDPLSRKDSVDKLCAGILSEKSKSINIVNLYCDQIEMPKLKEVLLTFSFDGAKIVIFKNVDKLKTPIKKVLDDDFDKIIDVNYIIVEIDKDYAELNRDKKLLADLFFKKVFTLGKGFKASASKDISVSLDDFKQSLRGNDWGRSLFVLDKLFDETGKSYDIGPQILGILNYKFAYSKNREKKKQYFSYLWEADRAIKEKGLNSRLVVERLIVKLFSC